MPWPTTYPFFHVDQPEQVDNAAKPRCGTVKAITLERLRVT